MKRATFNVNDQSISFDKEHSTSDIHQGDIVEAVFTFSADWNGMAKVAKFTRGNEELTPCILQHGTTCIIPTGVMSGTYFRMSVIGKSKTRRNVTKELLVIL